MKLTLFLLILLPFYGISQDSGFEYSFYKTTFQNTLIINDGFVFHTRDRIYFMDHQTNIHTISTIKDVNDNFFQESKFFKTNDSTWQLVLYNFASDISAGDDIQIVRYENQEISQTRIKDFSDFNYYQSVSLNKNNDFEFKIHEDEAYKKLIIPQNLEEPFEISTYTPTANIELVNKHGFIILGDNKTTVLDTNETILYEFDYQAKHFFETDTTIEIFTSDTLYFYNFYQKAITSKIVLPKELHQTKDIKKGKNGYYLLNRKNVLYNLQKDGFYTILYEEKCEKNRFQQIKLSPNRVILIGLNYDAYGSIVKSIPIDHPISIERGEVDLLNEKIWIYGDHTDTYNIYHDYNYEFQIVNTGDITIPGFSVSALQGVCHGYIVTHLFHQLEDDFHVGDTILFTGKFSISEKPKNKFYIWVHPLDNSFLKNCGDFPVTAETRISTHNTRIKPLNINPNPSKGLFNFHVNNNSKFDLFNCYGQIIKSGSLSKGNQKIDFQNLINGIYLFQITTTDGDIFQQKIIIQQ